MFSLTTDAVGVFVRSTQEVRQGHEQGGEAGQQGAASDEPRAVDSTPEETHKDDEDSVSHLDAKQQREGQDPAPPALAKLPSFAANLIESGQHPRLLAGEAVASLDGGDGALHVAGHQQLCQLQQTVTQHEELQKKKIRGGSERQRLPWQPEFISETAERKCAALSSENNVRMDSRKTIQPRRLIS